MPSQKTGSQSHLMPATYIQPLQYTKHREALFPTDLDLQLPQVPLRLFSFSGPGWGQASGRGVQPPGLCGCFFWCLFSWNWILYKWGMSRTSCKLSCRISKITASLDSIVETYPISKRLAVWHGNWAFLCFLLPQKTVSKQRMHSETWNHQLFLHVYTSKSVKKNSLRWTKAEFIYTPVKPE